MSFPVQFQFAKFELSWIDWENCQIETLNSNPFLCEIVSTKLQWIDSFELKSVSLIEHRLA